MFTLNHLFFIIFFHYKKTTELMECTRETEGSTTLCILSPIPGFFFNITKLFECCERKYQNTQEFLVSERK